MHFTTMPLFLFLFFFLFHTFTLAFPMGWRHQESLPQPPCQPPPRRLRASWVKSVKSSPKTPLHGPEDPLYPLSHIPGRLPRPGPLLSFFQFTWRLSSLVDLTSVLSTPSGSTLWKQLHLLKDHCITLSA